MFASARRDAIPEGSCTQHSSISIIHEILAMPVSYVHIHRCKWSCQFFFLLSPHTFAFLKPIVLPTGIWHCMFGIACRKLQVWCKDENRFGGIVWGLLWQDGGFKCAWNSILLPRCWQKFLPWEICWYQISIPLSLFCNFGSLASFIPPIPHVIDS